MVATVRSSVLREGDKIQINSARTVFEVRGAGHTLVSLKDPTGKTLYLTRGQCSACPWQITDGSNTFGQVDQIRKV